MGCYQNSNGCTISIRPILMAGPRPVHMPEVEYEVKKHLRTNVGAGTVNCVGSEG